MEKRQRREVLAAMKEKSAIARANDFVEKQEEVGL